MKKIETFDREFEILSQCVKIEDKKKQKSITGRLNEKNEQKSFVEVNFGAQIIQMKQANWFSTFGQENKSVTLERFLFFLFFSSVFRFDVKEVILYLKYYMVCVATEISKKNISFFILVARVHVC